MASVNSVQVLQNAATTDQSGISADLFGFKSALVEIVESAGGTATVTLNGSFDGKNWYAVGYQKVNATASPARAATGISVTASSKNVYAVLDFYPQLQAVTSSSSSSTVTVKAYAVA